MSLTPSSRRAAAISPHDESTRGNRMWQFLEPKEVSKHTLSINASSQILILAIRQTRSNPIHLRRRSLVPNPRQTAPRPPRLPPSRHLQAPDHLVRLSTQPHHRLCPFGRLLRLWCRVPGRSGIGLAF